MMRFPLPGPGRRGATMLVVLVVILLILGLAGSLFRLAIVQHRQSTQLEWQTQADWLARAGLDRAARRLETDPNFTGDTWQVRMPELGTVRVVITSTPAAPRRSSRRFQSTVAFAPPSLSVTIRSQASRLLGTNKANPPTPPTAAPLPDTGPRRHSKESS